MNARIRQQRKYFSFDDMEKAKNTMQRTWDLLCEDLKNEVFTYKDVSQAKGNTFLSTFDNLFVESQGSEYFKTDLAKVLNKYHVVRGTIIKDDEPIPNYERMLPKSEYIKEDNRFSPKGVEWLYLALGYPRTTTGFQNAKRCSEIECRAKNGDKFAVCTFDLSSKSDIKIVDLTVGNQWAYEKLQKDLERAAHRIARKEVKKYYEFRNNPSALDFIPEFKKWLVYTYAKMLSEQIFIPVATDKKTLMYAPFHCLAQYFLSLGYNGIIYKSTVYNKGKNLVLFDKTLVTPIGDVELYIV